MVVPTVGKKYRVESIHDNTFSTRTRFCVISEKNVLGFGLGLRLGLGLGLGLDIFLGRLRMVGED